MTKALLFFHDGKTWIERESLLVWIRESWGEEKAAIMERDIDRAVRDGMEKASEDA